MWSCIHYSLTFYVCIQKNLFCCFDETQSLIFDLKQTVKQLLWWNPKSYFWPYTNSQTVALMKPKVLFLTFYKQSNNVSLFYVSHSYRFAHKISSHSWFCLSLNKRIDQFVKKCVGTLLTKVIGEDLRPRKYFWLLFEEVSHCSILVFNLEKTSNSSCSFHFKWRTL